MDVIVSHFVFSVNGYRERFDCSEVQVGHLLRVTIRGLYFIEIDFVGEVSDRQYRNGDDEGVKRYYCDQLDDQACSQCACQVGKRCQKERTLPDCRDAALACEGGPRASQ